MGEEAMEEVKTIVKLVDEDQQGKALAIQGRDIPNINDANIYHNNQYGAKAHREAILNYVKQLYPEFFDDNADFEEIFESSNFEAEKDVQAFVDKNCLTYERPCHEFQFNAVDI